MTSPFIVAVAASLFVTIAAQLQESPQTLRLLCPHICLGHGTVSGGRVAGNNVTITCDDGYHVVGVNQLECRDDGTWSDQTPKCEKDIRCKGITGIEFGSAHCTKNSIKVGGYATFACDKNYKIQGQAKVTCQSDGTWDNEPPLCVDQRCPIFTHLLNGRVTAQSNVPGGSVTFQCNDNYNLIGNNKLTCSDDGAWEGVPPVCNENRCAHILSIAHGRIENYDDLAGSDVTVLCDAGYMPDGASNLTCNQNLQWSDAVPKCVRNVNVPKADVEEMCPYLNVKNGICSGGREPRSRLKCICKAGFKLEGRAKLRCNKRKLEWKKMPFPKCVVHQCPPVDFIANARVRTKYRGPYTPGRKVRVKCLPKYFYDGPEEMTCQDDATWSHYPQCIRTCPHKPFIEHGCAYTYNNRIRGGKVTYVCNEGYTITGSKRAVCNKTAQWSRPFPTCQPTPTCDVPCLKNGEFKERIHRRSKAVHYMCDDGFILKGSCQRVCRDGVWDKPAPLCEALAETESYACDSKPRDVYFVVDASFSIKEDELEEARNALRFLFGAFDIGANKTRAGLIKYNDKVETEFALGAYPTKKQLNRVHILARDSNYGKGTRTDLAMMAMMENFEKEGRAGRERICVLLTDGKATKTLDKMLAALHQTNIKIVAIGVGVDADKTELSLIASGKGMDNVYLATNFTALDDIAKTIATDVCRNTENTKDNKTKIDTAKPPEEPSQECANVTSDIYVVVDISRSIKADELEQERNCLNFLINSFDIAEGKSRLGLVKYHLYAETEFSLGNYTTRAALRGIKDLLGRSADIPRGTATDKGMNMAMDNFEKESLPGQRKVCILLTDGKATCTQKEFDKMTERLQKKTDIKVIAIGIGRNLDKGELQDIATGEGNANVYITTSFDNLDSVINDVLKQACEVTPTAPLEA